ncbi:2679_t:CDS:2 [Entrophospora sp. SA101]|nr:2679_t:CDS:2 [Entrophospora sp. SA101]
MKENQQKALRETDPIKKQALIAEIESDGKLLQQKYREHQEHSNKYRFNPAEKVRGMIDDPDNPFGNYGNNTYPDGNGSNHFPRQRKQGQPEQEPRPQSPKETKSRTSPRRKNASKNGNFKKTPRINIMYYEEIPSPQTIQTQKRKKQQQATMLIALILIGGLAYYFLAYVPEERNRAKEEIEEMFKQNFMVLPEKLDKTLWAETIERKAEELEQEEKDKPRKMREAAINNIKNSLEENEKQLPEIQKALEEFAKKPIISSLKKAEKLPDGKKIYPLYFDARAVYRIQFPPSLWNNLSEEQKELAKSNGHGELTLKDEVSGYKFSRLIED